MQKSWSLSILYYSDFALLSVCLGLHIAGNYLNHWYFILRNIVIIMKIPWTIRTVLITLNDALLLQGEQGLEGTKGETGEKVILVFVKKNYAPKIV